jgi:long-chain acyl-CoA synthetase
MSTLAYPDVPLHETLRTIAFTQPASVAIVFEDRTLTFADLDSESNRLAHGLRALGLASGDRLGLFLPNCPEFEIGVYAASKLGAIACPLNSSYREREITYQLNDSGAAMLITHLKLWAVVDAARAQLGQVRVIVVVGDEEYGAASDVVRYDEVVSGQSTDAPAGHVDPEQIAIIPYSSGTTGLPKGVMLSHRNLVCNHEQYVFGMQLTSEDSYVVYMPLSHIYGVALMGAAIRSGAKQILLERFDLDTVVRLIAEHGVTWLFTVPPILLALASAPGLSASQFRSIKYAFCAAAPLPPDLARRVEARLGFRVIQGYGLTEASPATHNSPLDPGRIKLESGGILLADTEHRIVDSETGERTLGPGEVGEIVVRGPQVMQGYWNAPEETAWALRGGWLHTGDIGWIDEEGYLYIVDRRKEMIKYKSFSIAPAELEAVILEHPDVADCGVTGVPDAEAGEVPVAFLVPQQGRAIDLEALGRFVAERVAGYKQIRRFEMTDSIPRTPSGKILRRMLKGIANCGFEE